MRRLRTHPGWIFALILAALAGCGNEQQKSSQRRTDWRLSLASKDKRPYGTAIAHQSLKYYFPAARQKSLRRTFKYTSIGANMLSRYDSVSLIVMLGFRLNMTDREWANVLSFASSGNEVMIFGSIFDKQIEDHFGFSKIEQPNEADQPPRYSLGENRSAVRLETDTTRLYGYIGRHIRSSFYWGDGSALNPDGTTHPDVGGDDVGYVSNEAVPKVLGRTDGAVNFMRYDVGTGHVTLHAAPLVMSNFFLLQPGNRRYLDGVWNSLPVNVSKVYWNEYYNRDSDSSDSNFKVLWRHPATRAALLLFFIGMLLYVLFSMKRRQRIIPIVKPVENTSVQFVETIGRLYYNQGVHSNLAEKMTQHFLEWVRSVYYIDTSNLNSEFTAALTAKSGLPAEEVYQTVYLLQQARSGMTVDENYLYKVYTALQKFYSRHPYSLL